MISPAQIVHRVTSACDAARDYRTCVEHEDPVIVHGMLCSLAFEAAKRHLDAPRATKFGPTIVQGARASLCLVVDERAVFVVVTLPTGEVSIVSDERGGR
jgi:hypothetical protein